MAELGNCQDETECRAYCENERNITPCVDFAEKHNLMSEEEISKARAFVKSENRPGDCKNEKECEAYCEDIENIDMCLSFAEENGFIDEKELKEAKQVVKALREGANLPGGCENKKECEAYCENTDHIEECVAFAEKAGFMSGAELEEAKKATKAIKSGIKPPGKLQRQKPMRRVLFRYVAYGRMFKFRRSGRLYPQRRSGDGQKNNAADDERRNARGMQVKRAMRKLL